MSSPREANNGILDDQQQENDDFDDQQQVNDEVDDQQQENDEVDDQQQGPDAPDVIAFGNYLRKIEEMERQQNEVGFVICST